ncbi:hypothetical protein SAMN05216321_10461 [Cupriavidus sp. OV038]|jgi:hypothetical protein|uniref:hypothetical protein n=1 Tax=unclassified Cupriavidus TaxID=2640874 RepID=UPI0008EF31F4|nr:MULTISPECIES: hypothetical protein [unclassified Cupriavidus]SFC36501.1 hypothetical protein SAMN05216321_10461 [Cupriavidus sp. OV038]SFP27581.1 hypothetical protein SAMN05216322_10561 [Cupriavidus sp. OV096]
MAYHRDPRPGRALGSALAGCILITLLGLGVAGCDTPPRDTSSTPPPPREPIAASDDVYPPPSTVHDTRPKRTTP